MRITAGIYRSRSLRAPAGTATRPTSDRVREALFGTLSARNAVAGARVLDLYAGTGALGLEALSRGAAHATFVESSREALSALRANVTALGLEGRTLVVAAVVERAVGRLARRAPFDLVLADPPWALVESGDAPGAVANLVGAGVLSPGALLVLEHSSRTAAPAMGGVVLEEERRYGDTALAIYKPAILDPSRAPPARTASE